MKDRRRGGEEGNDGRPLEEKVANEYVIKASSEMRGALLFRS